MTPDARRHYRELLGGFNLQPMGDDELEALLAGVPAIDAPAFYPAHKFTRLALALLEARDPPEAPPARSDEQVVNDCNELATDLARMHDGRVLDGEGGCERLTYYNARHPKAQGYWQMAVVACERLRGDDVESALDAFLADEGTTTT